MISLYNIKKKPVDDGILVSVYRQQLEGMVGCPLKPRMYEALLRISRRVRGTHFTDGPH
jgi:hypothetical protein